MTANAPAPEAHSQSLQRIIAGLDEGIILLAADGAIAWANASALGLHGADKLEDLGGTPSGYRKRYTLAYRNNDHVPSGEYPLDRLTAAEPFEGLLLNLGRKDDKTFLRQVHARGLPLESLDGADYRVLVLHDQTGRSTELRDAPRMLYSFLDVETLKRAERTLRESEERFSTAFRLAPVPMALCEVDSLRVLDANDAFATIILATPEGCAGQTLDELGLQFPEGLDEGLRRGDGIRNREATLLAQDGEQLDYLLSAEPIQIGGQQRLLLIMHDITERKRSETALLTAIEAIMQDTSWFTRGIIEKLARMRKPAPATRDVAELAQLTSREREVLSLMCQGHDDEGIAQHLNLSRNTVRNHVATIYSKIGAHRRSAAIVWARDRGITGRESTNANSQRQQP